MSANQRISEDKGVWLTCWTKAHEDALSSSAGHVLIPGGRWLIEILVPFLEARGARISGIGFEYSGYWWAHVDYGSHKFLLLIYYVSGLGNLLIKRRKRLLGLLGRRDDSQVERALAGTLLEGFQREPRIQEAVVSSNPVWRRDSEG